MDEGLRFVARLLEGEKMAVLYREFDVSRKTGYKIFLRFKDCGLEALDRRRADPDRLKREFQFRLKFGPSGQPHTQSMLNRSNLAALRGHIC